MKKYNKTFEDYFSAERSLKYCDSTKIEISGYESLSEFTNFFGKFLIKTNEELWMMTVKLVWLFNKFTYRGKKRKKLHANGHIIDRAFSLYMRQYVGFDTRCITRSPFFYRFQSYFKDFFLEFDDNNPFTNPELYEMPFKNVPIDILSVVFMLPERLDLLATINLAGLPYNQAMDWLLNWSLCENESLGVVAYQFMLVPSTPVYIRFNKKQWKKRNLNQ